MSKIIGLKVKIHFNIKDALLESVKLKIRLYKGEKEKKNQDKRAKLYLVVETFCVLRSIGQRKLILPPSSFFQFH